MTAIEHDVASLWVPERQQGRAGRVAVAVGLVAVLAGVLLAAALLTIRFDRRATVTFATGTHVVTLPAFGEGGSHVLVYEHGTTVRFSFPVTNRGRLPVTLESMRLTDEVISMLRVESVTAGGVALPVRLGAATSATVTVIARFSNCRYFHEREVETFPRALVDTSALGIRRVRAVDFDHDVVLRSPMIVGCPDRTLDRTDDRRPVTP